MHLHKGLWQAGIQNAKLAKAFRLEGEGFKPGKWKNKIHYTLWNFLLIVSYRPFSFCGHVILKSILLSMSPSR